MEQSCSKAPPPPPPSLARFFHPRIPFPRVLQPKGTFTPMEIPNSYLQYCVTSSTQPTILRRGNGAGTSSDARSRPDTVYRRNDPANRPYVMKKRPQAQVYHCVQCNKNIKYPSKITEHIRKHTGEKAHVCRVCDRSFSQAHTLKAHMLQHSNETPYKCSYCPVEFADLVDKDEHEESHLHPEALSALSNPRILQLELRRQEAPPILEVEDVEEEEDVDADEEGTQMCQIYECPEMCGFQSFDEPEVVAHIQIAHQIAHHHPYETVCWTEEQGGGVETDRPDQKMAELVHEEYTEYFPERFVPQVASESIIHESTSSSATVACTSNWTRGSRMVYSNQEEERMSNAKVMKEEEVEEEHMAYDQLIMQHHLHTDVLDDVAVEGVEEEDGNDVVVEEEDVEEDEPEHVRVIVNPNPPKRGTKSLRDHHEASQAMKEVIMEASTLVMAAPRPQKPIDLYSQNSLDAAAKKRKRAKKSMNVDWIIDAVAKGVDVSEASPHIRKKPTLHKCEYCGRVDKYPSKIRAHMRTHTGEKPFKCEICGMEFSQKTPLRLHLRRHLDQKPYECDVDGCRERFVSGAILKLHIEKKHLMKKKFVCHRGCGRVFSSSYNMRHHEKKCLVPMETYHQQHAIGDESMNGEYIDEDDEEELLEEDGGGRVYMDHLMDPSIVEQIPIAEQHFVEEPVFLHQ
ncbi:Protein CBG22103 [Caenorhabditis briggsae]|uniref:Protein CBG22103 n=2 Tax=Caenorhabditis briggsae TaxID=6238 RepID=A8Y1J2_CAEBR|nr:Protein CBG22103 [Caenorhabditis briggsae]ULU09620.1 hypothetical protein L3Y34_014188 [Caenorhabditis briggsae]CAP38761.1 Protein CBG22103 [Caenorhabditis briggsae]